MIEKVILDYLNKELDVPVVMECITAPEYVLIEKTGAGKDNHIMTATFAIQSYSDSLLNACKLNEAVKSAMERIIVLEDVSSCDLNSDYNYTDLSTNHYRYQAVFNLVHY